MSSASKGAAYENAFKHHLLESRRAYEVTRAAGSHGTYDLLAIEADAVCGYQLKSGRMSCRMAVALSQSLNAKAWPNFMGYVVHKTKEREFCEH